MCRYVLEKGKKTANRPSTPLFKSWAIAPAEKRMDKEVKVANNLFIFNQGLDLG